MASGDRPFLLVARIARAHGLGGEVNVVLVGDDPARLEAGRELRLEKTGQPARPIRVASARGHAGRLLVRFEGVDTRVQAEALTGGELSVRFDPADLGPGEYYPHQLEGLEVRTVGGDRVGRVTGVVFAPAREFLEVRPAGGGGTVLVPLHGEIVKHVDLSRGEVTIDPPAGLLEL